MFLRSIIDTEMKTTQGGLVPLLFQAKSSEMCLALAKVFSLLSVEISYNNLQSWDILKVNF